MVFRFGVNNWGLVISFSKLFPVTLAVSVLALLLELL
ncbi:Uncharacterised protein [Streptococcus pneumoniae]|nr:Uncharacterised protein [Streptococcus pneumoniae]